MMCLWAGAGIEQQRNTVTNAISNCEHRGDFS
jgi:hypothetical protein